MMLRYHPERYRVSRPFSRQVTNLYRSLARRGDITVDGLNEIQSRDIFILEAIMNKGNF